MTKFDVFSENVLNSLNLKRGGINEENNKFKQIYFNCNNWYKRC
jgi:hypothetical protein